ncbi:trypsin-like serine peptidase [Kutzneria sp. NPDC052558]|uniref:trypsin-like serine peptidase n=1 Tax=Kutzneria sp. NPDC052558 TaxID=3364121 RepID=UPI0037CBDB7D
MRRLLTVLAALALVAVCSATASGAARSWSTPIGVIAPNPLGIGHYCSASVVASPRHNVVLTAAHCVWDTDPARTAVWFLPAFNNGAASNTYGRWRVVKIIVPPQYIQWRSTHPAPAGEDRTNPYDYAFLIVDGDVQGRTGALTPVIDAHDTPATVAGYNAVGGSLSSCRGTANRWAYQGQTYLKVDCPSVSMGDGTSGGPFIPTGTDRVIGVMGGYQEGGPTPYVDYSSLFRAEFTAAYDQAKHG